MHSNTSSQEKGTGQSVPGAFREHRPANTLLLHFPELRELISVVLSRLVHGDLLWPQEVAHPSLDMVIISYMVHSFLPVPFHGMLFPEVFARIPPGWANETGGRTPRCLNACILDRPSWLPCLSLPTHSQYLLFINGFAVVLTLFST